MFNKISIIAFVLAVIATVFMYATVTTAQVVKEGLVSYWSFDNETIKGDIVKDVVGKNDGNIKGPKVVKGKVKEALLLCVVLITA
ncbi:hypothetical protein FJZ31_37220 [Candidatus Poribacteria bacterium]|nr:hypothetical protein [Candidatus Poribacteria bacterium]